MSTWAALAHDSHRLRDVAHLEADIDADVLVGLEQNLRRSYLWNPGCSTVRLYSPTGRSVKTNPPLASVTAERETRWRVGDAHFRGRDDGALRVAHGTEQRCRVTDLRQRHHNECQEQAHRCESFFPYAETWDILFRIDEVVKLFRATLDVQ